MSKDVTGLAVALTATARTRAQQLSRDLQAASRRLDTAADTLTTARRGYAVAAQDYRTLDDQALGIWTADELTAAGAQAPPAAPERRPPRSSASPAPSSPNADSL
jgi:hypothetical protein